MKFKSLIVNTALLSLLLSSCNQNEQKSESSQSSNVLKISTIDDPTNLDPRQTRDLNTVTSLRLFYEGLMRPGPNGLEKGLAESIEVSPDLKHYRFTLRKAFWSDGTPITAQDIEYSWKSMLDPNFTAPNVYQFYVIKNAKLAREGKVDLAEVGIKATDDQTLDIELENPLSYFLELTAFHAFFPISKKWDQKNSTEKADVKEFIVSGPFKPTNWAHHNVLVAEKNPHYWNASKVKLDQIQLLTLDENTALQMFEGGHLDWTGSPLSNIPPDAIEDLRKRGSLKVIPSAGTHLFRINVQKAPLANVKLRKALAYAIDRQALVDHVLQGGQTPALGFVPRQMNPGTANYFNDHDAVKAQKLFEEALKEMNLSREQLPTITLTYTNSGRNHKLAQAVQQQWKNILDLDVKLESLEGKVYFSKLGQQDYQIGLGSWFADIRDPINFLEVFKYKGNSSNNTNWENQEYTKLLDHSSVEADPKKREILLQQAETVLMNEMPLIPIFYSSFNYVKNPRLQGIYFSDLGYLDFTEAFIDNKDLHKLETTD